MDDNDLNGPTNDNDRRCCCLRNVDDDVVAAVSYNDLNGHHTKDTSPASDKEADKDVLQTNKAGLINVAMLSKIQHVSSLGSFSGLIERTCRRPPSLSPRRPLFEGG